MHKIFYYYGVYCFCLAVHDGLREGLKKIRDSLEESESSKSAPPQEKERKVKPHERYNAKGEPMAKIGF